MNTLKEIDLVSLLKDKVLAVYGALSYAELCAQVKNLQPYSYQNEIEIENPDYYQIEIDVVFDNAKSGPIRILGFIDDGKNLYGSYSRIISPDGNLVSEGGSIKRRGKSLLHPAFNLSVLRELPWSAFNFPRWQAVLGFALIGVLIGLDPALRAATPGLPAMSLGLAVGFSVLAMLVGVPIIVGFMRWWMQRGARWDGQGEMFNLIAASWLVPNVLGAVLVAVGVPMLLTLPLWLYSVWVGGNALAGAIPQASLGYSIAGIVISLLPAMLAAGLALGVAGFALAALTGVSAAAL